MTSIDVKCRTAATATGGCDFEVQLPTPKEFICPYSNAARNNLDVGLNLV
jgi:hypothetical protein